jgi:hypothetical protein
VEFVVVHELAHGVVAGTGREFGAEPSGFARSVVHQGDKGEITAKRRRKRKKKNI